MKEFWVNVSIVLSSMTYKNYKSLQLLHSCKSWDSKCDDEFLMKGCVVCGIDDDVDDDDEPFKYPLPQKCHANGLYVYYVYY